MLRKSFLANVPFIVWREGKQFIAYTPAFDLSTSGATLSQAKKRFREVLELFVEEMSLLSLRATAKQSRKL